MKSGRREKIRKNTAWMRAVIGFEAMVQGSMKGKIQFSP
jgi:hypothetical protein